MFVLNLLITIAILIMSFYLMIRGRFFQPSLQISKFGKIISWLGRVGLAANIVASFSMLVNHWVKLPYGHTVETIYGLAVCLILAALTHATYNERFPSCRTAPLPSSDDNYSKRYFHYSYMGMLTLVFGLFVAGPHIERYLFPVISDITYSNYQLLPNNHFCYDIKFTKLRDLTVDYSVFYLTNPQEKIYQQPNTLNGSGEIVPINRKRFTPGDNFSTICINLPDKTLDWTITPEVRYHTIAPLSFTQTLPTIDVKKALDGG